MIKFKHGSVRYRKNSSLYEFRFRINGQTKSIYAKTQQELKDKYATISLKYINAPPPKKILTFENWIETWYNTYKIPKLKESSLFQIRNIIKNHIPEKIKKQPLEKLSAVDIQKTLNENKSTRMAKYAFNVYTDVLGWAFKNGLTSKNIADALIPITHISKEGKALALEERKLLWSYALTKPEYYIFAFYLSTGCRPAEAFTIKWQDIDFKNNLIHIHGTKTQTSDRSVPIFKITLELLNKMPTRDPNTYLFPFGRKALENRKNKFEAELGFKFDIKDLRTTFATWLEEKGVDIAVFRKWLGHTSEKTTSNYYVKVLPEFERQEADKFNF